MIIGLVGLICVSCASGWRTLSDSPGGKVICSKERVCKTHNGVRRVVNYEFTHPDVPEAFDGFRMAFISDLHYKSLLKEKGLRKLVRLLNKQNADVLLMGGDYQEGCEYVVSLFSALSEVRTAWGTYAVLGNNDYERCYDEIVNAMERYGIRLLEHKVDTLYKEGQRMFIAGVRNPFDLCSNGVSPTLPLSSDDFVVLLVHTPEYAENVSVENADLVLSGHTHGGQVRIMGMTPAWRSSYGKRFLSGLAYNSMRIPVITTNGIGTSRFPVRIGAPAEIVVVTLYKAEE